MSATYRPGAKTRKDRRNGQFSISSINGKYLGKFDTHEQAQEWADGFRAELAKTNNKYRGIKQRRTSKEILDALRAEGINLPRSTLYKWMRDDGLVYVPRAIAGDRHRKVGFFLRLSEEVAETLDSLPNKAAFTEAALRMMFGLPTLNFLLIIDKQNRSVVFTQNTKGIQIILFGQFSDVEVQQMQTMVSLADSSGGGIPELRKHMKAQGFRYFGGE